MPSRPYPCVCGPISTVTTASSRPIGAYIAFTVPCATMLELMSPSGGSAAAVSSGTWPIFFHALTSPKSALHSSQTSMRALVGSIPSCLRNSTREPSRHSARTTAARSGIVVPPSIVNIDLSRRVEGGVNGECSFIFKPFHPWARCRPRPKDFEFGLAKTDDGCPSPPIPHHAETLTDGCGATRHGRRDTPGFATHSWTASRHGVCFCGEFAPRSLTAKSRIVKT